jgi:hypothetical protein
VGIVLGIHQSEIDSPEHYPVAVFVQDVSALRVKAGHLYRRPRRFLDGSVGLRAGGQTQHGNEEKARDPSERDGPEVHVSMPLFPKVFFGN